MDGDGIDDPDEEEYMDNKDKAIKKAMKMETIINEGASREEKRIVMMAIKKIAKYRSVPLHHAVSDVMRAAKDLEKTIGKK